MDNKKLIALLLLANMPLTMAFAADRYERENEKEDLNRFLKINYENEDKNDDDDVRNIQKCLKREFALDDSKLKETGHFGKITSKYVKEYQKKHKIRQTGFIGKITGEKLLKNCYVYQNGNNGTTTPITVPTTNSTSTSTSTNTTKTYKDGSYSVTNTYNSPGGLDNLGVTISIQNDKVTNVSIQNGAGDNTSYRYINGFSNSIGSVIVSKPLSSLNINVVAGASLTSRSFNDALAKIRTQAKI